MFSTVKVLQRTANNLNNDHPRIFFNNIRVSKADSQTYILTFISNQSQWLAWLKFSKCDNLSFLMAKLLFILDIDAQVLKMISI